MCSSLLFISERGTLHENLNEYVRADGSPSPFNSIPKGFYFIAVTMTCVGYGDMYPVTYTGQLIVTIAAIMGVLIIAIPVSVITVNFTAEFKKMTRAKQMIIEQQEKISEAKERIKSLIYRKNDAEINLEKEENHIYLDSILQILQINSEERMRDFRELELQNRQETLQALRGMSTDWRQNRTRSLVQNATKMGLL